MALRAPAGTGRRVLAEQDIVVNCIFRHRPALMFVTGSSSSCLTRHLFIDVSCDKAWASSGRADIFRRSDLQRGSGRALLRRRPQPSYLWNSATWEISEALLRTSRPSFGRGLGGDQTVRRSIEIRDGVCRTPDLSFQSRSPTFPHAKL